MGFTNGREIVAADPVGLGHIRLLVASPVGVPVPAEGDQLGTRCLRGSVTYPGRAPGGNIAGSAGENLTPNGEIDLPVE